MLYLALFITELLIIFFVSRVFQRKLYRLIFWITKRQKLSIYVIALIFIVGTFIHEMAHFMSALFLLVRAGELELIPHIEGNTVKLGSVQIAKTDLLRRNIIGVAPLLLGVSIIIWILSLITKQNVPVFHIILGLVLVFQVSNTMYSSKKDLESIIPLLVILVLLTILGLILGLRVPENFFDFLKTPCLYLLAPLAIDSIVVIALQ